MLSVRGAIMAMLVFWLAFAIPGVIALVLVVWAVLVLLEGHRHTTLDFSQSDNLAQTEIGRLDARFWKLGFYVNPLDSALYVPKRNPAQGWSINIGQPKGRSLAVGILLGIALLIALVGALPLYFVLLLQH